MTHVTEQEQQAAWEEFDRIHMGNPSSTLKSALFGAVRFAINARETARVRAPAADGEVEEALPPVGEVERLRGLLVEAVNTFSLIERDGATPSRTLNALADVPLRIRKALGILGERLP